MIKALLDAIQFPHADCSDYCHYRLRLTALILAGIYGLTKLDGHTDLPEAPRRGLANVVTNLQR